MAPRVVAVIGVFLVVAALLLVGVGMAASGNVRIEALPEEIAQGEGTVLNAQAGGITSETEQSALDRALERIFRKEEHDGTIAAKINSTNKLRLVWTISFGLALLFGVPGIASILVVTLFVFGVIVWPFKSAIKPQVVTNEDGGVTAVALLEGTVVLDTETGVTVVVPRGQPGEITVNHLPDPQAQALHAGRAIAALGSGEGNAAPWREVPSGKGAFAWASGLVNRLLPPTVEGELEMVEGEDS